MTMEWSSGAKEAKKAPTIGGVTGTRSYPAMPEIGGASPPPSADIEGQLLLGPNFPAAFQVSGSIIHHDPIREQRGRVCSSAHFDVFW